MSDETCVECGSLLGFPHRPDCPLGNTGLYERERKPLIPRRTIRRLVLRPLVPDAEQERRVYARLYAERRNVRRVAHVYEDLGGNLLALDRRSHERLHRGEDPHA